MSGSRHYYPLTGFAAKNEAGFHDANNGQTSRTPKNARRNALLGHVSKLADRHGRPVDDVLLGRVR